METCEYCGHPKRFHVYKREIQKPYCVVELGDEFYSGYQYKPEFEGKKEKLCGCTKVREVIAIS
jgi:hypothetical protein